MNKHFINKHLIFSLTLISGLISTLGACSSSTDNNTATAIPATPVSLGRKIFFDTSLSSNRNQSCATCHDPLAGFADPDSLQTSPVSAGSVSTAFGNRNAPTTSYASFSPDFRTTTTAQTSEDGSIYEGGQFYDGRSLNLIEQAKGPFLNPVEMNNINEEDVVRKVQEGAYSDDFKVVFGDNAFDNITEAYHNIAVAIAAFESSSVMNSFTSKFDAYQNDPANNPLTDSELRGFNLFKDETRAKCANCHVVDNPTGGRALFTNFKYFNVGTPANANNPNNAQDLGLGAITGETDQDGKFKVPTLRNIELTAPYMHNGRYQTLEDVINHYDIFGDGNIFPEVSNNIASEMNEGAEAPIGITPEETSDLVAFMKTLTDNFF